MKAISKHMNESLMTDVLSFDDLAIGMPIYKQGEQHGVERILRVPHSNVEGFILSIDERSKMIEYAFGKNKFRLEYGHLKLTGQLPAYNVLHKLGPHTNLQAFDNIDCYVTPSYHPKDLYLGQSVYTAFTAPRIGYDDKKMFSQFGHIKSFDDNFANIEFEGSVRRFDRELLTKYQMLADRSMIDDQNDLQGASSTLTTRSNMDVLKFMSILRKQYILTIPIDDFAGISVDSLQEFDNDMLVALEKQGYVKTDMKNECVRYTRKFYTKVNLDKLFGISSDLSTTNSGVIEFVRDCCKARTIKEFLVAFDDYDESFGNLRMIERDILKYTKHDLSGFIGAFNELSALGYVRQTPQGLAMTRQGLSYMTKAKL